FSGASLAQNFLHLRFVVFISLFCWCNEHEMCLRHLFDDLRRRGSDLRDVRERPHQTRAENNFCIVRKAQLLAESFPFWSRMKSCEINPAMNDLDRCAFTNVRTHRVSHHTRPRRDEVRVPQCVRSQQTRLSALRLPAWPADIAAAHHGDDERAKATQGCVPGVAAEKVTVQNVYLL